MKIKSNAKINLTLDIIGKRADGYHLLRSVMQPIPLYDTIMIRQEKEDISINCNLPYIPTDQRNLIYKAAQLFFQKTGVQSGIHVAIEKQIPVGAGLGGGSSNAAAILIALNAFYQTGISNEQLSEWSLSLGADVPFFIANQTQLAEGIGEKLTLLPSMPACELFLIMPPFSINTKWAFEQLTTLDAPCKTDDMIAALQKGSIIDVAAQLGNQLEEVITKRYPQIKQFKQALLKNGALGASMTGSGSAVFGIFEKGTNIVSLKDLFGNCHCFIMSI